jgi:hypothetical protein|tara:strand:+ start:625 stop:855 length:231 start_codon:yes stop_codon:yes gene_type:complete
MVTKKMKIKALKESILILESDLRRLEPVVSNSFAKFRKENTEANLSNFQSKVNGVCQIGGEIEELEKELKLLQGGK